MLRYWPVALLLPLHSCGLPRDPNGTSERIAATHELRVGVTDNAPWTKTSAGQPTGVEPDLVRAFASQLGAEVRWRTGSEATLAQALKHHELDLAIGGFDAQSPWKSIAGVSRPFAQTADKKKHVVLTAPGENGFILALDRFLTERYRSEESTGA